MKNYIGLFLLFVIVSSCNYRTKTDKKDTLAVKIEFAKNFNLVDKGSYTEFQLIQPESGKVEVSYALIKKGVNARIPAGTIRIEVPVKNMAVLSATHIGMLSALDQLAVIKGTISEKYISNAEILKGVKAGKIASYSDESSVSPAALVNDKIDLVVYSGFGGEFPNASKLQKLHIYSMANYDWREQHPLGKAEWIKVFGCLTGTEKKAEKYFKEVVAKYQEMKKSLAVVTERKKVIVGSLFADVWYAPAGESYMAQILNDAGADYIYKNEKGTGSCEKSFTQALRDQSDCNYWINPGATSISDLLSQNSKYSLFTAIKKHQTYCYTKNSNYFWEMSAVNPHWILSDFAAILGNKKTGKLYFYSRLD